MLHAFEYDISLALEELVEWFDISALTSTLGNLIPLATYVLVALSYYTIAKRRGIANPWLAWIPVAQIWVLGSISDNYQRIAMRKTTNRRKWLLGLEIAKAALMVVLVILVVVAAVFLLAAGYNSYEDAILNATLQGSLVGIGVLVLAVGGASIACAVMQFVALYDVYRSCEPKRATLFLVLNIFIGITRPILLMVARSKDDGMRPKIWLE